MNQYKILLNFQKKIKAMKKVIFFYYHIKKKFPYNFYFKAKILKAI